jgi:hypothetical protein
MHHINIYIELIIFRLLQAIVFVVKFLYVYSRKQNIMTTYRPVHNMYYILYSTTMFSNFPSRYMTLYERPRVPVVAQLSQFYQLLVWLEAMDSNSYIILFVKVYHTTFKQLTSVSE